MWWDAGELNYTSYWFTIEIPEPPERDLGQVLPDWPFPLNFDPMPGYITIDFTVIGRHVDKTTLCLTCDREYQDHDHGHDRLGYVAMYCRFWWARLLWPAWFFRPRFDPDPNTLE